MNKIYIQCADDSTLRITGRPEVNQFSGNTTELVIGFPAFTEDHSKYLDIITPDGVTSQTAINLEGGNIQETYALPYELLSKHGRLQLQFVTKYGENIVYESDKFIIAVIKSIGATDALVIEYKDVIQQLVDGLSVETQNRISGDSTLSTAVGGKENTGVAEGLVDTHKNAAVLDHPAKSVKTANIDDNAVGFDQLNTEVKQYLVNPDDIPQNRGNIPSPNGSVYTYHELDALKMGTYYIYYTAFHNPLNLPNTFGSTNGTVTKILYTDDQDTDWVYITAWIGNYSRILSYPVGTVGPVQEDAWNLAESDYATMAGNYLEGFGIDTALQSKTSQTNLVTSRNIYIDCNRTDTYTADGSISKPFKTISAACTVINSATTLHLITGAYTESSALSFPNYPIVMYGNGSTITAPSATIQNSNYVRYDLNTTGNVTFSSSSAGRVLIQGGSITGNITCNGLTDFKSCSLLSGTITVNSTAQMLAIVCTITSQITGNGIILLRENNFNATKSTPLITSTNGGTLICADNLITNLGSGGGISCNNGANGTTRTNAVSNNIIIVGSGTPVAVGTAVTVYSKNTINGTNTGTGYIPVSSDIIGTSIMALGSDATGDMYYRAVTGLLTRLGVGTNGQVLSSNGTNPTWISKGVVGGVADYNTTQTALYGIYNTSIVFPNSPSRQGTVKITVDNIDYAFALEANENVNTTAATVRNAIFPNWQTGGSGNTVTFTTVNTQNVVLPEFTEVGGVDINGIVLPPMYQDGAPNFTGPFITGGKADLDSNGKIVQMPTADDVGAEPTITGGTNTQFWNGLKQFIAITKTNVGLSNVTNPGTAYGGTLVTDFNAITIDGDYTGYGAATGAPSADYSWFVHHQNSNTGTISATQRAVAYSATLTVFERTKIAGVWGAWVNCSKGVANGVASLDSSGNLTQQQPTDKRMPTATSQAGKILKSDGSVPVWVDQLSPVSIQTFSSLWLTGTLTVNTSTDTFSYTGSDFNLSNGDPIEFDNGTGAVPAGITASTGLDGAYYNIINKAGTSPNFTFQICDTVGGSTPLDITSTGTAGYKCRIAGMATLSVTGLDLNAKKKYKILMRYSYVKKATSGEMLQLDFSTGLTGSAGFGMQTYTTNLARTWIDNVGVTRVQTKYSRFSAAVRIMALSSTSFQLSIISGGTGADTLATSSWTLYNSPIESGIVNYTSGNLTGFSVATNMGNGLIGNGITVYVYEEV